MNKVIREFYPVDRLPSDLRVALPEHGWVRIEIQPVLGAEGNELSDLVGKGRNIHGDPDAVLSHLRALREDR